MLEVLKFIFSSFWVWLGTCGLLVCLALVLGAALGLVIGLVDRLRSRSLVKDVTRN